MSVVRAFSALLVVSVLGACVSAEDADPNDNHISTRAEPGPSRALREAMRNPEPVATGVRATIEPPIVHLTIRPIDATDAEDGHGERIPSPDAVALDLSRDGGWPGRALDPSLHIGDATFRYYSHEGERILRFIAAGRSYVTGAPVFVQWGDDETSRIDVIDERVDDGGGSLDR